LLAVTITSTVQPADPYGIWPRLLAALGGLAVAALAWAQDSAIQEAKRFFEQYVALESAYDPGIADLYADEAFIKLRRSMPMGDAQNITMPAPQYKAQLRQIMTTARARGVRNGYSNVTYEREAGFVRIEALRTSEPGKNTGPISLLVGPSPTGRWLIYEEQSESRQ
jgi:hypothetical protein